MTTNSKKKFSFWVYPKEINLRDFLESKANVSEFLKGIIEKVRTGKLVDAKTIDLHRKKLEVDIRYKEIMIKIKEKELVYSETFDKTPSHTAQNAIKVNVNAENIYPPKETESYEPPEEKKIKHVIENSWNKFVATLKQNSKGEWTLTCKLCSTGFILPTKETAILRFKQHLNETHYEKVLD